MISLLIALVLLGFCACQVYLLVNFYAPAGLKFPLLAGLAVVVVIGLLVLVQRSGLLAGL